ncbi:MAG: UDP-N-acetylmuramate--L-alanine ligase [Bifidobacteriaceae bacterium]|nr:UDP-N-acetylmuramate--L-alanine ligase [Bifidobacteriaceae bacterium]
MTQGTVPVTLDPTSQPITYAKAHLEDLGRTHFIGIGGAGMSVLAEMMLEQGVDVSGSDREKSVRIDHLEKLGAHIYYGQQAENVRGAKTVVWSSAIKPDNPEIQEAVKEGKYLVHRSDILALLLASHRSVTVAGAHGKTTTSAMIAQILETAGSGNLVDPSYAIGGSVRTSRGVIDGGHAGHGDVMIAEADESDGSFEKYHPYIAVITNVEADHLDHYQTKEAFQQAFVEYAHHAVGHVIACADDPGALAVLRSLDDAEKKRAIAYTTQDPSELPDLGDVKIVRISHESVNAKASDAAGASATPADSDAQTFPEHFTLTFPSILVPEYESHEESTFTVPVELRVPGIHNARNAAAAITACLLLGMRPADAVRGIREFYGAARRFEVKGIVGGVTLIDDYAHHPTEIAALLDAARRRYPQATLRVLFQPHLFSRTHFFASRFAQALHKADDVIVTGIYPAREKQEDWPDVTERTIPDAAQQQGMGGDWISAEPDMAKAAQDLAARACPGDVIFTVGAGSVTTMDPAILDALHQRFDAPSDTSAQTGANGAA